MTRFQGKRVSRRWRQVLNAAARDGVVFTLNSGRRTLAEQWHLWRNRGKPGFAAIVAFPSPTAPHIRVAPPHALDVRYDDGGARRLAAWLRRHGATVSFPVSGEPWHLEVRIGDLGRVLRRLPGAAEERRKARLRRRPSKVGRAGLELIKSFEGFVGYPYRDAVGVWTIGYGHTAGVTAKTRPISKAGAERLLKRDVDRTYAPDVARLKLPLTQNQFDALVSLVYNVGPGALAPTTGIGKALRVHHWDKAADELLRWDKAGGRRLAGLTRRRRAERALFLRR